MDGRMMTIIKTSFLTTFCQKTKNNHVLWIINPNQIQTVCQLHRFIAIIYEKLDYLHINFLVKLKMNRVL